jgi:hypothetical protein
MENLIILAQYGIPFIIILTILMGKMLPSKLRQIELKPIKYILVLYILFFGIVILANMSGIMKIRFVSVGYTVTVVLCFISIFFLWFFDCGSKIFSSYNNTLRILKFLSGITVIGTIMSMMYFYIPGM